MLLENSRDARTVRPYVLCGVHLTFGVNTKTVTRLTCRTLLGTGPPRSVKPPAIE